MPVDHPMLVDQIDWSRGDMMAAEMREWCSEMLGGRVKVVIQFCEGDEVNDQTSAVSVVARFENAGDLALWKLRWWGKA